MQILLYADRPWDNFWSQVSWAYEKSTFIRFYLNVMPDKQFILAMKCLNIGALQTVQTSNPTAPDPRHAPNSIA